MHTSRTSVKGGMHVATRRPTATHGRMPGRVAFVGNHSKCTAAQRAAVAAAYLDGMRPARRVREAAERGELGGLAPFTVDSAQPDKLVRLWAKREGEQRDRDRDHFASQLAPRDAVELARRDLAVLVHDGIAGLKRQRVDDRDPERIRQYARATRELAGIPAPRDDVATHAPGSAKDDDGRQGEGSTRTGPAGTLLAGHRGQGATAHDGPTAPPDPTERSTDTGDSGEHERSGQTQRQENEEQPTLGIERARAALAVLGVGPGSG